jgi:hypothetical protein
MRCLQGMPVSFDTSHNKKVEGNYSGLVKRDTKRSARQYMNRIGDSRLLTTSQTFHSEPLSILLPHVPPWLWRNPAHQAASTGHCRKRRLIGERSCHNLRFSAFFSFPLD